MNETFDLRRLWLLVRYDCASDYRSYLVAWGVLAALMLLGAAWAAGWGNTSATFYEAWYVGMLFIGGAIVASYSFRELYDKTKNEAYLLLPASVNEKLVARMLRMALFFVCLLVFLTLTSVVIESLNQLAFGVHNQIFNPLVAAVWSVDGRPVLLDAHFVVVASLFFLGAAWFRRTVFIKTALVLSFLPNVLSVFAIALLAILFHGHYAIQISQFQVEAYYAAHKALLHSLLMALKILYFFVVPVLCWLVVWLRLREAQVSDGI